MLYSKQREQILNVLQRDRNHPTADELYTAVRAENPTISLATVYRNLNQLADNGLIMRINVPDGPDRYDPVNDGHYHVLCRNCGGVTDIPHDALPDLKPVASDISGCDIQESSVFFFGVCSACKSRREDNQSNN